MATGEENWVTTHQMGKKLGNVSAKEKQGFALPPITRRRPLKYYERQWPAGEEPKVTAAMSDARKSKEARLRHKEKKK